MIKVSQMTKEEVDTAKNHVYTVNHYIDRQLDLTCVYIPRGHHRDPILIYSGKPSVETWGGILYDLDNLLLEHKLNYKIESLDITGWVDDADLPHIIEVINSFSDENNRHDYFEYDDIFWDTNDIFELEESILKEREDYNKKLQNSVYDTYPYNQ